MPRGLTPRRGPLVLLAAILLASSPAHAQQPASDAQAREAAAALQRNQIDQAITLYTQALDDRALSNDRRGVIHNDRGVAQFRKQAYRAAVDDFNRAAQLYPEYAPLYNNRGNVLVALGAYKEAIKDFDRALILSPAFSAAYANRASAELRLGLVDQSVADYTRAIELAPQSAAAFNGRGQAHLQAERPHAAIRDLTRAVTLDPRFSPAYRNRAEARNQVEQFEEATEDLSRALAFDPANLASYLARAEGYLASGNAQNAIKDYLRVLETDPKSVPAFIGRGRANAASEQYDDALADLGKAIELDPKNSQAYAVRAWIYRQMKQLDLAAKDLERALKLEPVAVDAYWAEGEIEESLGNNDKAVAAFTKALNANPRHRATLVSLSRLGLVATREETELAGAGVEKWRVLQSGEQYVAVNEAFPNVRVPLEMMGTGQPKLIEWDRKKPPFANFGVLRFSAGTLALPGATPEPIESAAIIDLSAQTIIGIPVDKKGTRQATWTWDEGKLVVASAEGISEEFTLKGVKGGPPGVAAATAPQPRRTAAGEAPPPGKSGPPAWAPWAQPPQGPSGRQASRPQKSKSLFEMLFGN